MWQDFVQNYSFNSFPLLFPSSSLQFVYHPWAYEVTDKKYQFILLMKK